MERVTMHLIENSILYCVLHSKVLNKHLLQVDIHCYICTGRQVFEDDNDHKYSYCNANFIIIIRLRPHYCDDENIHVVTICRTNQLAEL